jgi:hypothetical protein
MAAESVVVWAAPTAAMSGQNSAGSKAAETAERSGLKSVAPKVACLAAKSAESWVDRLVDDSAAMSD